MKKLVDKIKSLDKGTVVRTLALVLAVGNQAVAAIGTTSFASSPVYQTISIALTIITAAAAAWKNNDFTYFAQLTTGLLRALNDGKLEESEVKELLDKAQNKEDEQNEADS
jgi:SPP1 family holin